MPWLVEQLRSRRQADRPVGLVLDYDGTLTAIAPRPCDALLDPETRTLLSRLARRDWLRLAVVTGRSRESLQAVAGDLPGIELATTGGFRLTTRDAVDHWHPQAVRYRPLIARLRDALTPVVAAHPGTLLEDKALCLAVHWRQAPQSEGQLTEVVQKLSREASPPIRLVPGKCVLELQPAIAWDKGDVVRLLAHAWCCDDAIAFFGDDTIDEPAFAAVHTLGGMGCRIGAASTSTRATCHLPDPAALNRLLRHLDQGH